MAQLTELNAQHHGALRIATNAFVHIVAKQHVVGIRAGEAGKAASAFPVFFTRNADSGSWALSAMTGLEPGRNLFVESDRWTAIYQPSALQTYPLFLMNAPDSPKGYAVGIDESSNALCSEGGEPLFDETGKPSIYLSNTTKLLEADLNQDMQTAQFIKKFEQMGLVKEININVHFENGHVQTITGLHSINEERLQTLDAAELDELNKLGYLLLAHAMLISIYQLNVLIQRNNDLSDTVKVRQLKLAVPRDASSNT